MSDGADPTSPPPADPASEQVEILRRRAAALGPRERRELLADIDRMLSEPSKTDSPNPVD